VKSLTNLSGLCEIPLAHAERAVGMVRCEECVPARLIITGLILHFLALQRLVLTKFPAQSENKVDNVTRSVSMSRYENTYREGSHRAGNS
jgi:hypothetical protein